MENLRELMRSEGIHAYLIPTTNPHQGDFGSAADARLAFISKFTGSAGLGIITLKEAALWVDSRYHLQAEKQVDPKLWTVMKVGKPNVPTKAEYLNSVLEKDEKIGFDPMLMSLMEVTDLQKSVKHEFVPIGKNLIDNVWKDKIWRNMNPIKKHPLEYAGKETSDKIKEIREELKKENASAVFVTALDDVAWLFNLRGNDVDMTPVFYSFALISQDDVQLFTQNGDENGEIKKMLNLKMLPIRNYSDALIHYSSYVKQNSGKIIVPSNVNYAIGSIIPSERRILKNLVGNIKCIKNDVEAEGMKKCHIRDGAAIIQYFHWLEDNIDSMKLSEYEGAKILEDFRRRLDKFQSLSFSTISSVGPNAAINHYVPEKTGSRFITKNEVYLVDSGGQYLDGTTDTTRTIHLGTPSAFEKECYTRVLKGFINVFTAIFPYGASEVIFDGMARKYLWDIGLDFGHKTGHGVGSYLAIHEYPPSLGPKADETFPGLLPNMFLSNEPGAYIDGKFGIRIEDIMQVVPVNTAFDFNGKGALKFDMVTLVPFQKKMMDLKLLTKDEISWINDYHAKCFKEVGDFLLQHGHQEAHKWLKNATQPISN